MSEADIARVIEVFEVNHVGWVLVGAHAIGLLTEPRATADFDFIIDGGRLHNVTAELTTVFGDLDETDVGAAVQLKAIDVDLIRSTNHPLFQIALEQTSVIGEWKVPRPEVLVVLKFLAAVSPWRDRVKRRQDMTDITYVHEVVGPELDRALMVKLSELVYPGAEREFDNLLGKIDRGEPI